MLIDEMHYMFDLGLDKVASQDRPDLYPNEKDSYLNRAIMEFVKARFGFNDRRDGFETKTERTSNLMNLHVTSPSVQPPIVPISPASGIYEVRLSDLIHRYLFLTSCTVKMLRGECVKARRVMRWQTDDVKNTFNEPSFDWGRIHGRFGKSTLTTTNNIQLPSLFFDTNDKNGNQLFSITEACVEYVKYPNRVCLGTYKHIDDKTPSSLTALQHCDIDDAFHDEIVNIAVEMAAKDIQDQFTLQTSQQRVINDQR